MSAQCDHKNTLVIQPDPVDGTHELVRCTACEHSQRRVSAAESIRMQAEQRAAESEKLWAEGFDGLGARVRALEAWQKRAAIALDGAGMRLDQAETAEAKEGALESPQRGVE
jgi:hypothetical protein